MIKIMSDTCVDLLYRIYYPMTLLSYLIILIYTMQAHSSIQINGFHITFSLQSAEDEVLSKQLPHHKFLVARPAA